MKWAALCAALFLCGCGSLARFEFETPQMGVPFKIVLYANHTNQARAAAEAAFARVSELNALLSDYEYDSELSRLGRTHNQQIPISPELATVLKRADDISRASSGALDVTVGPLVQLWRRARREQKLPRPELLERVRAKVGYANLVLSNQTAELKIADMRLDLGAIAKGYAADEALRVLRAHKIKRAFAAASGDMALGDAPPGERGWKVQVLTPADERGQAFLVLRNCGVATSGDLFQFVEIDGQRYSHIVDPKTGLGLTNRALVTVVAKDGITADGLSTAISVLPATDGLTLSRQFDAESFQKRILSDGSQTNAATSGFWKSAIWLK